MFVGIIVCARQYLVGLPQEIRFSCKRNVLRQLGGVLGGKNIFTRQFSDSLSQEIGISCSGKLLR